MTYEEKKHRIIQIKRNVEFATATSTKSYVHWMADELEKAWAALEMYANINNYDAVIHLDEGQVAREALNG